MISRMRRLLATLVALASVVVGVDTVAADSQGEVTRVRVPAAGLSLSLPSAWHKVDARTAARLAKETIARNNPQLASVLAELDRPGTGLVFFAFEPKNAEAFATNVNIVVSRIPDGVTLSQLVSAARSDLTRIPGRVGAVTSTGVQLPGGPAASSRVDVGVLAHGKRVVARVTQYAFLRPGRSIVVSFTTRKSTYAPYRASFVAAARSVRFG